jgi:hypothetical protein
MDHRMHWLDVFEVLLQQDAQMRRGRKFVLELLGNLVQVVDYSRPIEVIECEGLGFVDGE